MECMAYSHTVPYSHTAHTPYIPVQHPSDWVTTVGERAVLPLTHAGVSFVCALVGSLFKKIIPTYFTYLIVTRR